MKTQLGILLLASFFSVPNAFAEPQQGAAKKPVAKAKLYPPVVTISPFCNLPADMGPVFGGLNDARIQSMEGEAKSLLPSVNDGLKWNTEHHYFPNLEDVPYLPVGMGMDERKINQYYQDNPSARTALLTNEIRIAAVFQGWLDFFAQNGDPVLLSSNPKKQSILCVSYSNLHQRGMYLAPGADRTAAVVVEMPFVAPLNRDTNKAVKQFGMLAHELGHYLLQLNGHGTTATKKSNELEADCIAGALASTVLPPVGMLGVQAESLANHFTALGDEGSSPETHGSPAERTGAIIQGVGAIPQLQGKPAISATIVNFCVSKYEGKTPARGPAKSVTPHTHGITSGSTAEPVQ